MFDPFFDPPPRLLPPRRGRAPNGKTIYRVKAWRQANEDLCLYNVALRRAVPCDPILQPIIDKTFELMLRGHGSSCSGDNAT